MLSTRPARRANPPFGTWQPQGPVFPVTSVVLRITSLSGWRWGPLEGMAVPARAGSSSAANATRKRVCIGPPAGWVKGAAREHPLEERRDDTRHIGRPSPSRDAPIRDRYVGR